ncbi:hypothetical protein LZ198_20950 [Myxococcus sp. K15C18031901]|uniref:hypothetical protein n=1 Tax=Myxococcus dinghuensis TaxID=2906761 RepID=UPI0020A7B585|nr:hypothetical protein [Myxococcus dinghuensis]MCP3101346.1 hypothetical protein [Myxococcus dinghuensis]
MALLAATLVACAHSGRSASADERPQFEHVFQKPLAEALQVTREVLESHGHQFEPTEDPAQLLTTWQYPIGVGTGNNHFTRYLVTGISVGPRQSVVRIFRMAFDTAGNDASKQNVWWKMYRERAESAALPDLTPATYARNRGETQSEMRANLRGTRDLELERELTLRLESGPSIEVVSGNIAPEARPPEAVRPADFYLDRWKDVAATDTKPCGDAVRGAERLARTGLTLVIGEQLGSHEAPQVVGNLVCQLAETSLPVVLGLSLPQSEQERVDRYLASPGAPTDQDALLEGRFWHRPYQDGRSSRAILDLIDRVRAMRLAGLPVSLVAYDTNLARGSERDEQLAQVWKKRRSAHPDEVQLILAGNAHTRTTTGTEWDRDFTPMAHHLKGSDLVVLELSYAQGTRWGCDLNRAGQLTCGVIGATPFGRAAALPGQTPYITWFETPSAEGSHGLLYVGALSPSLPATSPHKVAPPPSSIPQPPPPNGLPPVF